MGEVMRWSLVMGGTVVAWALAYVYGCAVGLKAGKQLGRAECDAEWANFVENGAVAPYGSL